MLDNLPVRKAVHSFAGVVVEVAVPEVHMEYTAEEEGWDEEVVDDLLNLRNMDPLVSRRRHYRLG
jgi:hypothetical protein